MASVEAARVGGKLSEERWQSYRKLRGEAQRHEALADAQIARERKRQLKVMMRAQKRIYESRE